MSRLHDLERRIDQRLRGMLRSSSPDQKRDILEIHRAILEDAATHVTVLPGGKQVFPYAHVRLLILLSEETLRRAYELAFVEADAMLRDIRSRIEEQGAEVPPDLVLEVKLAQQVSPGGAERGFDISYGSLPREQAATETPEIRLTVLTGSAEPQRLCSTSKRIYLGRVNEVVDPAKRIVRRNDIAFHDSTSAPNGTVSRVHAHLDYDLKDAVYRLFDDRSTHGTVIIREGAVIPVPRGASRGVPLKDGDEIVLGQARIRVEGLLTNSADS